ncbi:hypothetical protein KPH14_002096 [Odynerus spinipes]|uniref:Uncharacterized protein n=1 Tax=Odynerus spinipes TaxID=1348599 RepID=A0AAD9RKV4_9HYME|nr:hypothetical protein KPH14_002096 [Odynerus spinipes]
MANGGGAPSEPSPRSVALRAPLARDVSLGASFRATSRKKRRGYLALFLSRGSQHLEEKEERYYSSGELEKAATEKREDTGNGITPIRERVLGCPFTGRIKKKEEKKKRRKGKDLFSRGFYGNPGVAVARHEEKYFQAATLRSKRNDRKWRCLAWSRRSPGS